MGTVQSAFLDNQRSIWSACCEDALVVETLKPTEDPNAWRELKKIYEASFDVDIQRSDLDQQVEGGKETAFVARTHRDDSCFQWLSSFVLKRQGNVVGFTAVRPLQVGSNEAIAVLEYFAVKPSERRQGYGTELLQGLRSELIEAHPEKRFSYILAEVPPFVGRDVIRKGFCRKNEALKLQLPNDYKIPKINPINLQFDELGAKVEQLLLIPVDGQDARPSLPADYVRRIVYGMYHDNYGMGHERALAWMNSVIPESHQCDIPIVNLLSELNNEEGSAAQVVPRPRDRVVSHLYG